MEVMFREDGTKEFIGRSYGEVRDLALEYINKGAEIWINPWNACEDTWLLTVEEK